MNPIGSIASGVGSIFDFLDSVIPDAQQTPDAVNPLLLNPFEKDNTSVYILLGLGVLLLLLIAGIIYVAVKM